MPPIHTLLEHHQREPSGTSEFRAYDRFLETRSIELHYLMLSTADLVHRRKQVVLRAIMSFIMHNWESGGGFGDFREVTTLNV
jgi:hypothetical protein